MLTVLFVLSKHTKVYDLAAVNEFISSQTVGIFFKHSFVA